MKNSLQRRKVRLGDISVSYLYKGADRARATVVFIHGFPFNKNMWEAQLEDLPEDVVGVSIDVRGHGRSTVGQGYFSIDLFAQDLIDFVDQLALNQVILCGISMGGYIALRAREIAPNRFSGLVLVDTHPFADSDSNKVKRFETIQSVLKYGKRTFAIGFVNNVFSEKSLLYKQEEIELIRSSIRRNEVRGICSTLLALAARTDTSQRLGEIEQPCLLIRGEEDKLTTFEQMNELHKKINGSQFVEMARCGHLPNLEDAPTFNRHLHDFLSSFR